MNDVAKGFIPSRRTTAHLAAASEFTEAKPNGSNKEVSFQFILKEQQVAQHFGALQAEL